MNEEKIRKIATDQGIDLIGFFPVAPLSECLSHLEERVAQGFSTGFEGATPQERIDYLKHFSKAKAGIVIGVNYYQSIHRPDDDTPRGAVAAVAWGRDYHEVLREKMRSVMDTLNQDQVAAGKPKIGYEIYADNSPLVDRGSAYRAGLGFFGKNNCLINKTLGSYFFIGQILADTDIEFSPKAAIKNGCGECRRCLDACPNKALGDGFSLDPSKCVAFLTQKKELTPEEEKRLNSYLYGCDLCQQVCPYNQELEKTKEERFWADAEMAYPKIEELLKLSNKTFKNQFGKTAAGWRGKKIMVRNAKLFEKNKK